MPSAYFGLNMQGGGTPQVRRYNGLSASTVGNTFGTAETPVIGSQPLNRVIQFGSQNTFLALVNNKVWRSTDAGVNWTNVYSFAGLSGYTSGLNIVYVNGIPFVCFIWSISSATAFAGSYSTDGITWTQDTTTTTTIDTLTNDTVFRNALCVVINGGSIRSNLIYSPGSPVVVVAQPNSARGISSALCVFNDTLLYLGINTTSGNRNIYALEGGTFVSKVTLATAQSPGVTAGKTGMFVDSNSGNLIVFSRGTLPGAWICYSVDSAYSATDISSTVLPAGMLVSAPTLARVLCFVDGQATPGSNPDKYVIYASDNTAGTLLTMYKWEGVSTTMTNFDSGGNILDGLSLSENCQGVGNWTSGENSVSLIDRTPVSGGIRLSFKLYSNGGATVVSVRAWYGTQFQEYPLSQATISNASNGAITLNVNTGLTADNGATTYQFTWNSVTDGVDPSDRFRLILEAFV